MEKSTNGTLTEDEIIELLVNSGYEEDKIKEALKQTQSHDVDTLVDYIIKLEEQGTPFKIKRVTNEQENKESQLETLKLIEENTKRIQKEREYKEELIRRTLEDKKNREKEDNEFVASEKTKEIKWDCTINVRFPDSRCVKYSFNKEDTVNDLFDVIEKDFGSKTFKIIKSRTSKVIERSNIKLEDNPLLYPKAVLFLEE